MTKEQAAVLMTLLEVATDGNWPSTVSGMLASGYEPADICNAWGELERIAGMAGCAPGPADF